MNKLQLREYFKDIHVSLYRNTPYDPTPISITHQFPIKLKLSFADLSGPIDGALLWKNGEVIYQSSWDRVSTSSGDVLNVNLVEIHIDVDGCRFTLGDLFNDTPSFNWMKEGF